MKLMGFHQAAKNDCAPESNYRLLYYYLWMHSKAR